VPCEVPDCPAIPEHGKALCALHRLARLAKALNIARQASGKGGQRCLTCRRYFKALDWVLREPVRRDEKRKGKTMRPGDPYGYSHVQCEPPTARLSKRKIREEEKPLFPSTV